MSKTSGRVLLLVGFGIALVAVFLSPLCVQWIKAGRHTSNLNADYYAGLAKMAGWIGWSNKYVEWENAALCIRQEQAQLRVRGLTEAEARELRNHIIKDVVNETSRNISSVGMVLYSTGKENGDARFIVLEKDAEWVRESIRNWRTGISVERY